MSHRMTAGRQALINVVIVAAVLGIFATQFGSLEDSFMTLARADKLVVIQALCIALLAFPVAAASYWSLAVNNRPISYPAVLLVQVASGFVNRLLPIGLGSLGLYVAFFKKRGIAVADATAVVMTNNILGIVGTLLLAGVIFAFRPEYIGSLQADRLSTILRVALLAVAIVVIIGFIFKKSHWKNKLTAAVTSIAHALKVSLKPDLRTAESFVYNIVLTAVNAGVLSLAVTAAHGSLAWPAAVLVLSIGTLVGAAIPTPGGIGGVEAGLLAAMLAYGVAPGAGLAAVFLYRGLTYWLPIIPGVIAFRYVQKHFL